MKRLLQLLSIVMLVAFVASACAPAATPAPTEPPAATEAPPEEVVEIYLFHQYTEGGGAQPVWVQLTEEYMAANPNIKIKWEWAGWEMFDQKLSARIEAGESPDAVWSSAAVQAIYAREGLTVPIDEYLAEPNYEGDSTWLESFYPSLIELSYVEDAAVGPGYYTAPTGMYSSGIFYNTDIFAEQGMTPPETWSELMEICEKLKAAGIIPFAHDGGYTPYNVRVFMYVASRVAGEDTYYDTAMHKEGTSWVDNPDWLKVAEETRTLFGYMQPGVLGSAWPAAQIEFSQGLEAMMIIPDWLPSELMAEAPEDFHMDIFRFPAYEGGKGDQTATELKFNGMALLKDAKHPRETMDFLKFLSSRHATGLQAEQFLISAPTKGAPVPEALAGSQNILATSKMMPFQAGVDADAAEWMGNVLEPLLGELALGMSAADFVAELQKQSDAFYAE